MIRHGLLALLLTVSAGLCGGAETVYRVVAVNRSGRPLRRYPVVVSLPGESASAGGVEVRAAGGQVLSAQLCGDTPPGGGSPSAEAVFLADFPGAADWRTFVVRLLPAAGGTPPALPAPPAPLSNGVVEVAPGRWGQYLSAVSLLKDGRSLPFFSFVDSSLPVPVKPLAIVENGPVRWRMAGFGVNEKTGVAARKRVTLFAGRDDVLCEFALRNDSKVPCELGQMAAFSFLPAPGGRLATNVREYGKDVFWSLSDPGRSPITPALGRLNVYWGAGPVYGTEDEACGGPDRSVAVAPRIAHPLQTILYNLGTGKPDEQAMQFTLLLMANGNPGEARVGAFPMLIPAGGLAGGFWIRPAGKDAVAADPFPAAGDVEVFLLR